MVDNNFIKSYWTQCAKHFGLKERDYEPPIILKEYVEFGGAFFDGQKNSIVSSNLTKSIAKHELRHKVAYDCIHSVLLEAFRKQNKPLLDLIIKRTLNTSSYRFKSPEARKIYRKFLILRENFNDDIRELSGSLNYSTSMFYDEAMGASFNENKFNGTGLYPVISGFMGSLKFNFEELKRIRRLTKIKPNIRKFHILGPLNNETIEDFEKELENTHAI